MNGTILKTTLVLGTAALISGCIGRQLPPSGSKAGTSINEPSGAQPSAPGGWEESVNPAMTAVPAVNPENGDWIPGIASRRVFREPSGAQATPAPQPASSQQTDDSDMMQP